MKTVLHCLLCSIFLSCGLVHGDELAKTDTVNEGLAVADQQTITMETLPAFIDSAKQTTDFAENTPKVAKDEAATESLNPRGVDLEERMEKRLGAIDANQIAAQGKISQLEEKISQLEQLNAMKMEQKYNDGFYGKVQKYADHVRIYLGTQLFIAIVAAIIVLFLIMLIYLIVGYNRANVFAIANYPEVSLGNREFEDNENSTDEDMDNGSKLNLARAYMDMEDYEKALSILREVLSQGNDDERNEAQDLIDKIKNN